MGEDGSHLSSLPASLAGRTILQIIPQLDAGGAERTTIDIAAALAEVGAEFAMPTAAIVNIDEVVAHLGARLTDGDRARIAAYRAQYGAVLV